jgi:methyl-accepting chemotaxis protein
MKFKQKVVIASSLILVGTLLLLSLQQLGTAKQHIDVLVDNSMEELVTGIKNIVAKEMSTKESLAQVVTETVSLAPEDRNYVKTILEQPELKASYMGAGLGYQSDGKMVENDDNWSPPADYDPRKRPWYQKAVREGKRIVTEPYLDVISKTMIISIATPIYQSGRLVGSMYYDLNLSQLSDVVNSVSLFDAGYLFLVTQKGVTIAHPNSDFVGKSFTEYLPGVQLMSGTQHVEINDKSFIIDFTPIPDKEDWYVGAVVDESIAFGALDQLRNNSIIYTVLGVIIGLVLLTVLMNYLMRPLGTLNHAIQDIASGKGDLTRRLDTNLDQEFSELAAGFNQFTESLQLQIKQSKSISQDILAGIDEVGKSADRSSSEMQAQMKEVDQLATAMNEMAATASDVANNAQGAATAAKEADDASKEGSEVVTYTTTSIHELSQRIDQAVEEVRNLESATTNIETILKVINEIADQTNLLALNAAIEAARAGDSGRGFAVVADEVRTLAQRTQESTTEIRTMIEQLQSGASSVSAAMDESKTKADEAVEKSHTANEVLGRISQAIQHISDMNVQIASAAEEQSLVAEEINSNMLRIKDISENVSQSADDAKTATQSQVEKTHQQEKLLNQFIV